MSDNVVSMVYGDEASNGRVMSPDELVSNTIMSLEQFIEDGVINIQIAINNCSCNNMVIGNIPNVFTKSKEGYYHTVTGEGIKRVINSIEQLTYILHRISAMDTAVVTYNSLKMSVVPVIEEMAPIGLAFGVSDDRIDTIRGGDV